MNFLDNDFPEVTEAYRGSLEDWLELFERYAFPVGEETDTSIEMKRYLKHNPEATYEDWLDRVIKFIRDELWYEEKINLSIRELYLVVNKVTRLSKKLRTTYNKLYSSRSMTGLIAEDYQPNVGNVNRAKIALFHWLATNFDSEDIINFFIDPALVITDAFDNTTIAQKFRAEGLTYQELCNAAKVKSKYSLDKANWCKVSQLKNQDWCNKTGIYILKHDATGRVYIGETSVSFFDRTQQHFSGSKEKDSTFHTLLFLLGGKDAFSIKMLKDMSNASLENILKEEKNYVQEPFSSWLDFNCREGGEGGARIDRTTTEIELIVKTLLNARGTQTTYDQLSNSLKQNGIDISKSSVEIWNNAFASSWHNSTQHQAAIKSLLTNKNLEFLTPDECHVLEQTIKDPRGLPLNYFGGFDNRAKPVILCEWNAFYKNTQIQDNFLNCTVQDILQNKPIIDSFIILPQIGLITNNAKNYYILNTSNNQISINGVDFDSLKSSNQEIFDIINNRESLPDGSNRRLFTMKPERAERLCASGYIVGQLADDIANKKYIIKTIFQ